MPKGFYEKKKKKKKKEEKLIAGVRWQLNNEYWKYYFLWDI